jgi:hypothetical protein
LTIGGAETRKYARIWTNINATAGATGKWWFRNVSVRRKNGGNLIVDGSITASKLSVTSLSAITADLGTVTAGLIRDTNSKMKIDLANVRIVFDNGSVMKVTGAGFGTSNQFLEWFGPRTTGGDPALCTEATAIYYLKTNGSAYFGGTLSAGTLFTAKTTTDTSATASITIGPYGTNGNSKAITVSYTMIRNGVDNGNTSAARNVVPSVTIQLYQTIGAGAETLVSTQTFTGSINDDTPDPGPPSLTTFDYSNSGSFTFTDSTAGTASRTYRATISARSGSYSNGNRTAGTFTQNLTVQSVE